MPVLDFGLVNIAIFAFASAMALLLWRMLRVPETAAIAFPSPEPVQQTPFMVNPAPDLCFDFDLSGAFSHCNPEGDQFMRELGIEGGSWSQLRGALLQRFPDLPARIYSIENPSYVEYHPASPADPSRLILEAHSNGITVLFYPVQNADLAMAGDVHDIFSSLTELPRLKAICAYSPAPIWMATDAGKLIWANPAFQSLDQDTDCGPEGADAPLFALPETLQPGKSCRVRLRNGTNTQTRWFNITQFQIEENFLHFAQDIDDVVRAESAKQNFVQTLAKTFAHLSTGLAIFDRNRRLVMFNPALIDLTHLSAEFLSGRPDLFSIFDELRNRQIMPEPKSYASWRDRMSALIESASEGNYSEVWTLPNSQTYRVTGRPHPDGAIAFLIQDISAEIALTRRHRANNEITQSALNALSDAIAVFSASGELIQCNSALMNEWNLPQACDDTPLTITEATRNWQSLCQPTPVWGDLRDYVQGGAERAPWSAEVTLKSGATIDLQVTPIASGASLLTLRRRAFRRLAKPQGKKRQTAA